MNCSLSKVLVMEEMIPDPRTLLKSRYALIYLHTYAHVSNIFLLVDGSLRFVRSPRCVGGGQTARLTLIQLGWIEQPHQQSASLVSLELGRR